MNKLEAILETKRAEIAQLKQDISDEFLKSHGSIRAKPKSFIESLRSVPMGLIAEIKRKSPSAGVIREDLIPDHIAEAYEEAGAQAISLLIDKTHFGGEESDFISVRDVVDIPILYKEFVVDCWQIWHARSLGASAVLLIVAALGEKGVAELMACAARADLEVLLEVHSAEEMKIAHAVGATCVGINNRDLTTMHVSLDTSYALIDQAPKGALIVSESGIRTTEDVARLHKAGAHAVLVGEHLLRQEKPGDAARKLMSSVWASS